MMETNEKPSFYAILPAHVRYEKRLKPAERLLFAEISALTNKFGYCTASNSYFSELYETKKETVSRWISHLSELGFVKLEMVYEGKQIKGRKIWIDEKVMTPIDEKVKGNNTRLNNTRLNNTPLPPNDENGKDDLNADAFVSADAKTHEQDDQDVLQTVGQEAEAEQSTLKTNSESKADSNRKGNRQDGNVPRRRRSDSVPCQAIADCYNEILGDRLPNVQLLNETRKRAITARWMEIKGTKAPNGKIRFESTEDGLNWFASVFRKVAMNPFWMGDNSSGFAVSFDWIFKPANFLKIIEWRPPKH
nr:MAG TPA: replisome organizer protein [Caudoviricetes sp.]